MMRAMRGNRAMGGFVSAQRWKMLAGCVVVLMLIAMVPAAGRAQNFGLKNLQGKVYDANDQAISGAIVYLKNSRNNDIKTFLSDKDGGYRFAGLSADTDYSVWAAYHGKKSGTKAVSSFDSRKVVYIDLKIKD